MISKIGVKRDLSESKNDNLLYHIHPKQSVRISVDRCLT